MRRHSLADAANVAADVALQQAVAQFGVRAVGPAPTENTGRHKPSDVPEPIARVTSRQLAAHPNGELAIDDVTCPTKCDKAKRDCGYSLRDRDYSLVGKQPPILVDWIYVDAVDGVLVWDEGGVEKREALPDD